MINRSYHSLWLVGLIGFSLAGTLLAQSAVDNVNVNLQVTPSGGGGGGGGGGGDPTIIRGCIDPIALNYNSSANTDDGSCLYYEGVPNVLNFQAIPTATTINLSWQNPIYDQLAAVRIVRLAGQVPLDPGSGQLIYEGRGESFIDTNVTVGITYVYAAFVRSTTGQYSSGAIAQAIILPPTPPDEPPFPPPDQPPPGGRGDDVFDLFPDAADHDQLPPQLIFLQPDRPRQLFTPGQPVYIDGGRNLTVFLPLELATPGLKTIGLTLFSPTTPRRVFSFILKLNDERTGYTATIAPLGQSGQYDFALHLINYRDQRISKITGTLLVSGAGLISDQAATQASRTIIGLGVAAGVIQFMLLATQTKTVFDLYLLLLRVLAAWSGYFGLRRRSRPWGVVYDAVTKRPIDPALVQVLEIDRPKISAITDIDGRYGFYLPPGVYRLKVQKTHYRFPSQILAGRKSDEFYNHLYFGEPITVSGAGEVINRNIPIDPIGFDWNEFIKNKSRLVKARYHRERRQWWLLNSIYLAGFAMALYHALSSPTWFDFLIVVVYLLIYAASRFWIYRYPAVSLKRAGSGEPLSYSVIKVFLADLDQEIRRLVTDELGRFYLLVRPGNYYFIVEEKLPDGTYKEVYRSASSHLATGVLKQNLVVP